MRAREFTINIPIHITLNGDGEPDIDVGQNTPAPAELDQNPVMVTPQQQELELMKAQLGKKSPVINKLTANDSIGSEHDQDTDLLDKIKQLIIR